MSVAGKEAAGKKMYLSVETVINGMLEAVAIVDLDGTIRQVNSEFERSSGWKKEEAVGKTPIELGIISKEDAQRIEKEVMPKLMKEGLVQDIETIAIRRDGTKFPVLMNWTLVKDAEGKSTGIITVARDITELKRAERVLRESEEKFRLAFENAMDAIFWADPKTGLITNCNKAAEILLEKKREEIVGCHQTTVHPPQKAEYYANMFKKHIEREGAVDEEAEVITKSGKIKPVHITASVTLVGGKPIIQGIFRDITERKRAEEERLKAAANERRVNELEKFARVAVGRELKMVELKKRIKELESKLKEITGKG